MIARLFLLIGILNASTAMAETRDLDAHAAISDREATTEAAPVPTEIKDMDAYFETFDQTRSSTAAATKLTAPLE